MTASHLAPYVRASAHLRAASAAFRELIAGMGLLKARDLPLTNFIVRAGSLNADPPEQFFQKIDLYRDSLLRRNQGLTLEQKLFLLKVINILILKYEYSNYHAKVIGMPVGFMLDPFNGCNLRCPSCHNSPNVQYRDSIYSFTPGAMKAQVFEDFISKVGITALNGHFYNKNEPLLNKRTPDYVRRAAKMRIRTMISSSFSIPKLDVDAIAGSGLDELLLAIDGADQAAYEIYRRRGDLELVFENTRRLVEARKKLGGQLPWIRWQFLTFEHNVEQVEKAIELAKSLGVDEISIGTACSVDMDDPDLKVAIHPLSTEGGGAGAIRFRERPNMKFEIPIDDLAVDIEAQLAVNHLERFRDLGALEHIRPKVSRERTWCDWPYFSVIVDAHGRFIPCDKIMPKGAGRVEYAQAGRFDFNDDDYRHARLKWINRAVYDREVQDTPVDKRILCNSCEHPIPSQTGFGAARGYLQQKGALCEIDAASYAILTSWNETQDRHCQLFGPVTRN